MPSLHSTLSAKHPAANIKNIVTKELGVRGQVDLINFPIADGDFNYLLNSLYHGMKKLTLISLVYNIREYFVFFLIMNSYHPTSGSIGGQDRNMDIREEKRKDIIPVFVTGI